MLFPSRPALGPLVLALFVALQIAAPKAAEARQAARVTRTAKNVTAHKQRPTTSAARRKLRVKPGTRLGKTSVRLRTQPVRSAPSKRIVSTASKTKPKETRIAKPAMAARNALAKLKANPGVARATRALKEASFAVTRTLDAWQARAPPWLARAMAGVRTYSLSSIAAYSLSKVASDKKFLGTYFAASSVYSYGVMPAATALGLDPVLSGVLNAVTTPLTLGVIVLRERHLRKQAGEELSLKDTARTIGNEYREFAKARMVKTSQQAHAVAKSSL